MVTTAREWHVVHTAHAFTYQYTAVLALVEMCGVDNFLKQSGFSLQFAGIIVTPVGGCTPPDGGCTTRALLVL